MEVIVGRCCGLDVHQAAIVACALVEVEGHPRELSALLSQTLILDASTICSDISDPN